MKIFFVSDLHGADRCFRKFLNAGKFYRVDWLVMGGDAAGKLLVPLVPYKGGWVGRYHSTDLRAETETELTAIEARLTEFGAYPFRASHDFVTELERRPDLVETTIRPLILERCHRWVELARERLGGGRVQCLMGLGNDDYDEMAEAFATPPFTFLADGVIELDGFSVGSVGWSNITPWHTNRERTEEGLAELVAALGPTDPARTIFNIHVPPYGSGLDTAPRLDDTLQIQLVGGSPDFIPIGSTAVADGIRRWQPLLSLHGHVHESRGVIKWGPTTIVNPGSEYDQGTLFGALIDVDPGRVRSCQLVAA